MPDACFEFDDAAVRESSQLAVGQLGGRAFDEQLAGMMCRQKRGYRSSHWRISDACGWLSWLGPGADPGRWARAWSMSLRKRMSSSEH